MDTDKELVLFIILPIFVIFLLGNKPERTIFVDPCQEFRFVHDSDPELLRFGQLGAGVGSGQQVGGVGADVFRNPAAAFFDLLGRQRAGVELFELNR